MIFSPLNIEQELIRERMRQEKLIDAAQQILEEAVQSDEKIIERLQSTAVEKHLNIQFDEEDRKRLFGISDIGKICIRYRLRFLDSSFFKAEFPYEAIAEIRNFERKHGLKIEHFKIMAPDHAFNLENINKDPLLFAQLTDGSYFLLHKWGDDLAWYKKYLFFPMQNPIIFFATLLACCGIISLSIPAAWMNVVMNFDGEVYLRIWLILHLFIMFTGLFIWAGLAFDKNFSCNTWNSKYYNW
jgi:hypothetical protein